MIDTTTKGDPAQVRAAAEWLDPALKDAADTVSNGAALIPVAVRSHWFGESADAYVSRLSDLGDAADEIVPLARDAAVKLRSYAGGAGFTGKGRDGCRSPATPGEQRSWDAIRAAKLRSYRRTVLLGRHWAKGAPGASFAVGAQLAGRTALLGRHSFANAASPGSTSGTLASCLAPSSLAARCAASIASTSRRR